jgi:cytochrome P450
LYADVSAALRDPRFSANRSSAYKRFLPEGPDGKRVAESIEGMLAFKDPPHHTRLRALVNKAFTPRALEALRPRIAELVDQLLDRGGRDGELHLVRDLAYPLPVTVILEMLGIPREDADALKPLSADIALFLGAMKGLKRALASTRELEAYMLALIAERRSRPREDMLSALVSAEVEGTRLTDAEVFHMVHLLLFAGHHTTMNLIGNGMLALLRHAGELARLRADPSLVPSAIEEMLRFDSPVQNVGRVAMEDLEIGGVKIESGQLVLLLLGAANHDPDQFAAPERLDVGRAPNKHLAFAGGPHFCLGAPLTRIEGQIVFEQLLRRFVRIEIAGAVEWVPNVTFRGLQELRVAVS